MARGHADYVRHYRVLDLVRTGALMVTGGAVLVMWTVVCWLVLASRRRSLGWLPLAAAGPFGLIAIAMLKDRAPASGDLYQQFIRKLKMDIGHSEGFQNFVRDHQSSSSSGGGFVSFGPIFLGGSHSHSSASGSTQRDYGYKYDNQGMTVPGMQCIGFKCHVMPQSPNPLSTITDWV